MVSRDKSNFESFLECISPRIPVHYHNQTSGGASSSSAVVAEAAEEVRGPHIVLRDVWSAYEEWSYFGLGVPLSLENMDSKVTQYYAPSLSAIQIFTLKPLAGGSSSRSSAIGTDGTETDSDNPNSSTNYKRCFVPPDLLGHLYFQYNETKRPFERDPFTLKITELAGLHNGLNSLTSLDLSPYSWISVAWYPIYQIPSVKIRKELSASFATYHLLTPQFPDDKVNEQGMSSTTEVVLPPLGAVTYKAFGNVWIMPGTSDEYNKTESERLATSWLGTLGFYHSDFNFFMSRKFYGGPR